MSKLTRFLDNVAHFAPLVLAATPLAPIAPAGYEWSQRAAPWTGGRRPLMIFRQFLAPKTGCASYLFG